MPPISKRGGKPFTASLLSSFGRSPFCTPSSTFSAEKMIAIRNKLGSARRSFCLKYTVPALGSSVAGCTSGGVLHSVVLLRMGSRNAVRPGHFAYLKEDMDDEYKKVTPADLLDSRTFVESVTVSDMLACRDKLVMAKRQDSYKRNNSPKVPEEKRWSHWMQIREGHKREKFDPNYNGGKFFSEMNFVQGGTISENPVVELDESKEGASILSELGKGSVTGVRFLGDQVEHGVSSRRRELPVNESFNHDVGFERLPSLNLGRQYDTGLKFDRTRPTMRKDRYATVWSRPDFEPKKQLDGSMDSRPVFEFDLAKTEAARYRGGERYLSTDLKSTGSSDLKPLDSSTDTSKADNSEELPEDNVASVRDFMQSAHPLGVYSRPIRDGPGFRYMTSWEQVFDAFNNISGEGRSQDVSQAFFAIKHMQPSPPHHVLVEMADKAVQYAHEMMPVSLTNILHSCAKLKFVHPPLLKEWQEQFRDSRVLEACTDLDITSVIYSFGVLNRIVRTQWSKNSGASKWERGLDSEFVEQLALEAVHPVRMENYSYSMLVNILYGLSLLRYNKHEILNKLLNEITKDDVLPRLEIQNLNAAIYAVGYIRFWSPDYTTKLLTEAVAHLSEFPSAGIANMMWSLGNLRYQNHDIVGKILKAAVDEKHLRNYGEQDLTSLLYGMAMCRYKDPDTIGPVITELMRPGRISQMHESALTHLLSSFSCLRYSNHHLFQAILNELTRPTRIKNLQNMQIANAFYAMGACRYNDPTSLQLLVDEVQDPDKLASFNDFDLATIVHGAGGMGIRNDKFVSALMTEVGKKERMERYSAQSLVNIVNACSLIQHRNEDMLSCISQQLSANDRVKQMTPAGITTATLALCRLQFYDSKYFSTYLKETTAPKMMVVIRPSTLVDLMFGCMRADVVHFARFMEVIKLMRSPRKLMYLLNFPFVRLVSIATILGLRDEEFLEAVKAEILKDERRQTFNNVELRDLARGFERLGFFDDKLCDVLNYGRRVKGQSVGILAPGALKQAEQIQKASSMNKEHEESNLDWSGQMRPTFYGS